MMITTFCHNSECHTDNQWICHKLLMSSLLFIFKSENISLYYLCVCRPHQLEQMRAMVFEKFDLSPLRTINTWYWYPWDSTVIPCLDSNELNDSNNFISKTTFAYVHTWSYAKLMQIWFLQNLAKVKVELEQTAER